MSIMISWSLLNLSQCGQYTGVGASMFLNQQIACPTPHFSTPTRLPEARQLMGLLHICGAPLGHLRVVFEPETQEAE